MKTSSPRPAVLGFTKLFLLTLIFAITGTINLLSAGNSVPPTLISQAQDAVTNPTGTRAVALEAVTMKPEPFPLTSSVQYSPDTRTRICVFAMNLQLLAGEGANAFTADVQDASGKLYPLKVEFMGQVPNFSGITMFVLRLSDDLGDVGDVLLRLNLHGIGSNRVRVGIGHNGGGPTDDANSFAAVYKPVLTGAGQTHPITRLQDDRGANQKAWNELPPISVSEVLANVKPGASVLLEARRVEGAGSQSAPLLVQQRYGRGQTLALTASDTWRWRMRMDSKNNAHETFWRQMLRYVVSATPQQIEIGSERDVYAMDDTVNIVADIRDKRYNPVSDAHATARVTKPSGAIVDVPLTFTTLNSVNTYAGQFKADELGEHRIELTGTSTGLGTLNAKSSVLVSDLNREYYSAAQNSDLLKRIAAETGGKYYTPAQAQSLLDDLVYRQTPYSERVTKDLWDMPFNFLVIIGLLSAEWFLRKREGLA